MFNIYFAGDLFDQKHVTGNIFLAREIEKLSNNVYTCILPQDWEGQKRSCIETRNNDIKAVIEADLVLFNFDGVDLDSGTIVEFMIAKMLDIPVVLLRTDCRNGGHFNGADWNLMALGYPRSLTLKHSALVIYNEVGLSKMHEVIATSVINAFETVQQEQSLLKTYQEILTVYQLVIKMCGSNLEKIVSLQHVEEIIIEKIRKNIYRVQENVNALSLQKCFEKVL